MWLQLGLLLILLIFSAFFSGAETALFSLTRHEISRFQRDRRASHRLVGQLLQHPKRLLLTLMIGNVSINMFIFAVSLELSTVIAGHHTAWAPILGLVSPIIVTLCGELLPKGTSIITRNRIAPKLAPLVQFITIILTPFSATINFLLVEPMTRLLVGGHAKKERVSAEELHELVQISQRRRVIDADENAMLSGVVHLDELHVHDVMVPRVDMIAVDVNEHPDRLRQIMGEQHFMKLPVFDEDADHILGLVHARDLFLEANCEVHDLIQPVRYLPEVVTLTQALRHFQQTSTQLAIAVDEHGGVAGLVTLEDVAEQIVGALTDPEAEEEADAWEQIGEKHYRVSGQLSIHEWAQYFQIGEVDPRVSTLAGHFVAQLGRIPAVGDQVKIGNLLLTVESLRKRRVEHILIELLGDTNLAKEASQ